MSGHSKWNNIKRKKEKTDAQRGKIFTKILLYWSFGIVLKYTYTVYSLFYVLKLNSIKVIFQTL